MKLFKSRLDPDLRRIEERADMLAALRELYDKEHKDDLGSTDREANP